MRTFLLALALTTHCFAVGVTFVAADGIRIGGTGDSLATTAGINVSSGSLAIVAAISDGSHTVASVANTGGDTCVQKIAFITSGAFGQEIWYCNNMAANASDKFTVTWNYVSGAHTGSRAVLVSVYTGQDSTTPLQTATVTTVVGATNCGTGSTRCQSGTLTTTAANETLVAVATNTTGGTLSDFGGNFTNRVSPASSASALFDYGSGGGLLTGTGYAIDVRSTSAGNFTVSLIGIVPSGGSPPAATTAIPVVF
jgi:hypothetical protein